MVTPLLNWLHAVYLLRSHTHGRSLARPHTSPVVSPQVTPAAPAAVGFTLAPRVTEATTQASCPAAADTCCSGCIGPACNTCDSSQLLQFGCCPSTISVLQDDFRDYVKYYIEIALVVFLALCLEFYTLLRVHPYCWSARTGWLSTWNKSLRTWFLGYLFEDAKSMGTITQRVTVVKDPMRGCNGCQTHHYGRADVVASPAPKDKPLNKNGDSFEVDEQWIPATSGAIHFVVTTVVWAVLLGHAIFLELHYNQYTTEHLDCFSCNRREEWFGVHDGVTAVLERNRWACWAIFGLLFAVNIYRQVVKPILDATGTIPVWEPPHLPPDGTPKFKCADPEITRDLNSGEIKIICSKPTEAVIYWTMDGEDPLVGLSQRYLRDGEAGPYLSVSRPQLDLNSERTKYTIKAIAVCDGFKPSPIATTEIVLEKCLPPDIGWPDIKTGEVVIKDNNSRREPAQILWSDNGLPPVTQQYQKGVQGMFPSVAKGFEGRVTVQAKAVRKVNPLRPMLVVASL